MFSIYFVVFVLIIKMRKIDINMLISATPSGIKREWYVCMYDIKEKLYPKIEPLFHTMET
jgi:hypothetical protein